MYCSRQKDEWDEEKSIHNHGRGERREKKMQIWDEKLCGTEYNKHPIIINELSSTPNANRFNPMFQVRQTPLPLNAKPPNRYFRPNVRIFSSSTIYNSLAEARVCFRVIVKTKCKWLSSLCWNIERNKPGTSKSVNKGISFVSFVLYIRLPVDTWMFPRAFARVSTSSQQLILIKV